MPSIKMKSTGDILRENNSLHVCQNSSKISKTSSFSRVRNVQHEAGPDMCPPNKQDDSISKKDCCEVVDTELSQIQKLQSHSSGFDIDCRTDHTANCSSNIETIFSPILESVDFEPNIFDYQTCNVSDLFNPDMNVSSSCLLDYESNESSSVSGDEYMLLPFLEDSIESINHHYEDDNNVDSEPVIVSDDSNIYMAIHQLKTCNHESDVNSYLDWDPFECLDPQMFIKNLLAPKPLKETKSITLALDLDETLVHSTLEHCDDADFTFTVFSNLKEHTVYVKQRPYLRAFLDKVSEMFRIVIFTASQSIYAKQLLDILDPDGKIISGRAYREACIFADGGYTKDLTVLGVDLSKIVIIDNSPQVFRLQVNNGIPIKSWFDDPSDCALITLLPFLETLVDVEDVRPIIAKRFGNKE
ncbi:uncharacterized protein [Rutidosis leptorrhynchoides]|uniref:uncharacterized protein n=1 Tax=Rutidosis leptorrhynchoides TaxID=125765 RepID=UPI003A996C85